MLVRAVVGLVVLLVLSGCGGSNAVEVRGPEPTLPPGGVPSATLEDLRLKLASISQDECARDDPATVYPDCGRFVAEIEASLAAVRDRVPAASPAADAVQRDVTAYTRGGCAAAPNSGPAGDPATCASALGALQRDVRTMVRAVAR